jgi:aspartyl-tRNA(Asn)/glutamyl-tRNA(Gln) amidotransferase subunit A
MFENGDDEVKANIDAFVSVLEKSGVEFCKVENTTIAAAKVAWNILMSAELCNNVSRYDGVKYGYRSPEFSGIDELYTNSRTEAFGELLKTAILFGSETLSTDNYMKVYDKALRTRRVISVEFAKLFEEYDAVLMPACSAMEYTEAQVKENKYISYEENFYTAPASITGLPAVCVMGVQLVGKAFSENALLNLAEICEKEGK